MDLTSTPWRFAVPRMLRALGAFAAGRRGALAVLAATYGAVVVLLWCSTDAVARPGPFAVACLGAGCAVAWAAVPAAMAAHATWRERRAEPACGWSCASVGRRRRWPAPRSRVDRWRSGYVPLHGTGLSFVAALAAVVLLAGRAGVAERTAAVAMGSA